MAVLDAQTEAEALATCEAEPIRSPDRVQAHGGLIVSDRGLDRITHVSQNIETFVARTPADMLGTPLSDLLQPGHIHAIRNALSLPSIALQREFLGELVLSGKTVFGAVHLRGDRVLLELTLGTEDEKGSVSGLERLRWLMTRQMSDLGLKDALEGMTRDLQAISGFDRVMAYRFRPDGSGEVLAEAREPELESFLGLRFPSQDIPQIARAICVEQPLRVIADTSRDDVPILTDGAETTPLDMTLAELRGTSPVHTAYLRNMGVGASLVLPVVVDNRLWGLFSCHHRRARVLSAEETRVVDLVGRMLNMTIATILKRDLTHNIAACEALTHRLSGDTQPNANTLFSAESWSSFADELMAIFKADGVLLSYDDRRHDAGLQPPRDLLAVLDKDLIAASPLGIASRSDILKGHAGVGTVAGMMRIDLFPEQDVGFWLFRGEENEIVRWAGPPEKDIETTAQQTRLHPRSSFKAYAEMSKGSSRAWEPEDIQLAEALQSALRNAITLYIERSANEERLGLMVQELNHRVRNILSVVQSLVRQSAESNTDVNRYAQTLEARLLALASAHDLLSVADSEGLSVDAMVSRELTPFDDHRIVTLGPDVQLRASASTVFALVLHELATNAVKYGALSMPRGSVSLTWDVREGALELVWHEKGGPSVAEPDRTGFGLFLIEQAVGHQLDGQSSVTFQPNGIEVRISIPQRHLMAVPDVIASAPVSVPDPDEVTGNLDLGTILVLEDDVIIASESRSFFLKAGADDVVLVGSNAKAIAAVKEARPDFAILDIDLGQEGSGATARHLREIGVPFVFLTGYANEHQWIGELPAAPLLNKPLRHDELLVTVKAVLSVAKSA